MGTDDAGKLQIHPHCAISLAVGDRMLVQFRGLDYFKGLTYNTSAGRRLEFVEPEICVSYGEIGYHSSG